MLDGVAGDGGALAMRVALTAARALGATALRPITRAHVDGCLYHGPSSLDFVDRLRAGGARVSAPTTLNVGLVDLLHPELNRGDKQTRAAARALMEADVELGCEATFTCGEPRSTPAFAVENFGRSPGTKLTSTRESSARNGVGMTLRAASRPRPTLGAA